MSHARDYFPVPGDGRGGRPIKGSPEEIETALWLLAKNGGSPTRAHQEMILTLGWDHITMANIKDWSRGRFRARYEEIRSEKAALIEEIVASRSMEHAEAISEVEGQALKRVQAGLADANAVEASIVLRNLTQSKATNIDKAGQLRGRDAFKPGGGDVTVLFARLERSGLFNVIDSTAEEVESKTIAAEASETPSEAR